MCAKNRVLCTRRLRRVQNMAIWVHVFVTKVWKVVTKVRMFRSKVTRNGKKWKVSLRKWKVSLRKWAAMVVGGALCGSDRSGVRRLLKRCDVRDGVVHPAAVAVFPDHLTGDGKMAYEMAKGRRKGRMKWRNGVGNGVENGVEKGERAQGMAKRRAKGRRDGRLNGGKNMLYNIK